jgi:hypothetical protein
LQNPAKATNLCKPISGRGDYTVFYPQPGMAVAKRKKPRPAHKAGRAFVDPGHTAKTGNPS